MASIKKYVVGTSVTVPVAGTGVAGTVIGTSDVRASGEANESGGEPFNTVQVGSKTYLIRSAEM